MSFITSPGVIVPPLTAGGVAYGTGSQAKVTSAGTIGQFLQSNGAGVPFFADAGSQVKRVARTSNTVLLKANNGNLIDITSGTFSQTFDAAATLDNGWFCYIRNSGTGVITLDPASSETIDSLTSYAMYPGECRMVQCTGTAFFSVVLSPFLATITATATFIQPPGYSAVGCAIWGGGGGGGGAQGQATNNYRAGGGSGGGGARNFMTITAPAPGTSVTATVGAGGTGGAGGTNARGDDGTSGGDSSFGSYVYAYGGANGRYGTGSSAGSGGGGGGAAGAGSVSTGGLPRLISYSSVDSEREFGSTVSQQSNNIGFGGGGGRTGQDNFPRNFGSTEYGGSGGGRGGDNFTAARAGGKSVFGPTGGGGGALVGNDNNAYGSAAGGGVGYQSTGGGAAGGNGGTTGTAGTAGSVLDSGSGGGGGGGGASTAATGGAGGAGSVKGGGGGGGGGGTNTGGAGGDGGRGQIDVWGIA